MVPVMTLHGSGSVSAGSGKNGLIAVQRGQGECIVSSSPHPLYVLWLDGAAHRVFKPILVQPRYRVETEHRNAEMFPKCLGRGTTENAIVGIQLFLEIF